ncbi:MAG TPA: LLM class flavin-dependent oxidoreductase [Steroidobacteraceae bacterium]|jgi:alkanesulfonate monooxygenase SsuD/methylene tetrahydromethanopterin reductase-like flavin-dependent oxidoreductase (luciferase family)|nr:LLM class flavin-dependent oxidoreductase [Steroidobacteraceae bacterium]
MQFNNFLGAYYRDTSYGGDRLYADMLAQAKLVDRLGFRGVTIPEHHLINILLIPDPLQFAVKVASITEHLEIVTSVCQLPLHDMRIFAGQVIQADILCDGRLVLGVGRGAFAYELARMGKPIEQSRERFDESLNVLMALLAREEVSWAGKYYQFAPITVMPRPRATGSPAIMIAALVPEAIEASARRGFHIQTTPLNASVGKMREQVDAFTRGKAACGESGRNLRLAVMRVCCVAKDDADVRRKLDLAYDYYGRFQNVFTGPGIVEQGVIKALPLKQSKDDLRESLLICTASEMIDRLKAYEELGVDELIVNGNIGHDNQESLDALERFAADVMPCFSAAKTRGPIMQATGT